MSNARIWPLRGLSAEDMGAMTLALRVRQEKAEPGEADQWQRIVGAVEQAVADAQEPVKEESAGRIKPESWARGFAEDAGIMAIPLIRTAPLGEDRTQVRFLFDQANKMEAAWLLYQATERGFPSASLVREYENWLVVQLDVRNDEFEKMRPLTWAEIGGVYSEEGVAQ